jgi:hypothetical protein
MLLIIRIINNDLSYHAKLALRCASFTRTDTTFIGYLSKRLVFMLIWGFMRVKSLIFSVGKVWWINFTLGSQIWSDFILIKSNMFKLAWNPCVRGWLERLSIILHALSLSKRCLHHHLLRRRSTGHQRFNTILNYLRICGDQMRFQVHRL